MNDFLFSRTVGLVLIGSYAVFTFVLTYLFSRRHAATRDEFLVAGRSLGTWSSAFSIAATWIWAPALFVASQKAYTQGLSGVFWFTVPNVLCLILFAHFARKVRQMHPDGFTLSAWLRTRFSRRVQGIYLLELGGLAACSFAVQLLAGGVVLSSLTGLSFGLVTVLLALVALTYSVFSGLKASVVTDYAQMVIILLVCGVLVPWAVWRAGGGVAVWKGLGGIDGEHANIFGRAGRGVFVSFGIPVTIGLLAGPFGDQSFWQRAFATRAGHVHGAFVRGALVFATVPILLSLLGFAAAGNGWAIADTQRVNLDVIVRMLPAWTAIPFTWMLLSGLCSTLDSNLCSIASMAGHDLTSSTGDAVDALVVARARIAMFVLAGVALAIANIPGMKILYLFLFYGTLRASTLLPTIGAILSRRVSEAGMFWGPAVAIAFGLPVFAWGRFTDSTGIALVGSLLTVLSSGAIVYFTMDRVARVEGEVAS